MRIFIPLIACCALACDDGAGQDPITDAGPDQRVADMQVAPDPDAGDPPDMADPADMAEPDAALPMVTRGIFEATSDLDGATFFDQPWPADWRMLFDGRLDVRGYPLAINSPLLESLKVSAGQQVGAVGQSVIWFRFDGPIDDLDGAVILNLSTGEPVPSHARVLEPDPYVPQTLVAIAPQPGVILAPSTQYAAWLPASETVLPPATLTDALDGAGDFAEAYAPLAAKLPELGLSAADLAAATVFTTGDAPATLFEMSEAVRAEHDAGFGPWVVDPDDGADHPRFCELHGTLNAPDFMTGQPPYNSDGIFEIVDGVPQAQGVVAVPIVLTLPKQAMPEGGYPLVIYLHGSGGLSTQGVDRGRVPGPDQPAAKGEGPAHVLAAEGFATISAALPLNPERGGTNGFAYLNFQNLRMFRNVFRQGVLEQRLLIDALSELVIDAETVAACAGLDHQESDPGFRVQTERVFAMGQSMGGQYTNLLGAVEPRIRAVVPTGAGGYWSWFILFTDLLPAEPLLRNVLGAGGALNEMHPGMHLLALAWEPVEPFVYMPRLSRDPLPDHPRRDIYEPVGRGDVYFKERVFDAAALAYGTVQAGEEVWDSMQPVLALDDRDGFLEYPITENRDGYTAVVVQYPDDGILSGHDIFQQLDAVKQQYATFFRTAWDDGRGTVVAPSE